MKFHYIDYGHNSDLPQKVRDTMPDDHVQSLFRTALNKHLQAGKNEMHSYIAAYKELETLGYGRSDEGKWVRKDSPTPDAVHVPSFIGSKKKPKDKDDPGTEVAFSKSDVVAMNVPTLMRVLEAAMEDVKDDEQLHRMVERLIELCKDGKPLTMDDYDDAVSVLKSAAKGIGHVYQEWLSEIRKRISGNSNIPLNAKGQKLAKRLGERIAAKGGLDVLYSSPLKRAVQTADAIAASSAPGLRRAKPSPDLQPWHLGDIEGKQPDEVHNLIAHYIENPDEVPSGEGADGKSGECFSDAVRRQIGWLQELYQDFENLDPTQKLGVVMHSRGMELLQGWVEDGMPDDLEVDADAMLHPKDPTHADVLRWHKGEIKEIDIDSDDPLKPGVYLILHSLTDDDTDEGNPELQKMQKFVPPDEVATAARGAYSQGTSVIGITAALSEHEGMEPDAIRQIAAHFADTSSATEPPLTRDAWGGAHAAKWAARVIKKLEGEHKPAESSVDDSVEIAGSICKLDTAQHLAFGWASIVSVNGRPVTDTQGDQISEATIENAAYEFCLTSRIGGEMHEGMKIGQLVESVVYTPEKVAAQQKSLNDQGIPAVMQMPFVGWWVGFHITDDAVWQRVVSGELRAFSVGGKGKRDKIAA